MAKKKPASAKKTESSAASASAPAPAAAPAPPASTTTATTSKAAAGASPTPAAAASPAPTHATLQVALLRCAALCVASKSTLRSNDLAKISTTNLEDVPTHEQILADARALFKRLGSTVNALALAVKVSAAETKAEAAKKTSSTSASTSAASQPGAGSPLAGLDGGSIAAAQAQIDILATELLPKLVYVSRKTTKESLVRHGKLSDEQAAREPYANWGGLGEAFARALNRAVRETVDSVESFVECFMDLKTRAAMLAAEQARYRAAVDRGEEEGGLPARPQAHPRIENLTPAAQRKRALIRYDALYKLCERLADPAPPPEHPIPKGTYSDLVKGLKSGDGAGGMADEDEADKLDPFEVTLARTYMTDYVQGLPRDNWEALQRFHATRSEQLQDAVREVSEVLRWAAKRADEEAAAGGDNSGTSGENKAVAKKDSAAGGDEDFDDDVDLDDLDYLALDDYAPADVDRARRALPVIERVLRVHDLIGAIFADPTARPPNVDTQVPRDAYDKLAERSERLLEDVDEMIGYCIYAGDAVTEARQAAEDDEEEATAAAAGANVKRVGSTTTTAAEDEEAKDRAWEAKEAERIKNGDNRPYDPAVAKVIAESAENLFAEFLVEFAQSGIQLGREGAAVAAGEHVAAPLKKLASEIEEECKKAVGAEAFLEFSMT